MLTRVRQMVTHHCTWLAWLDIVPVYVRSSLQVQMCVLLFWKLFCSSAQDWLGYFIITKWELCFSKIMKCPLALWLKVNKKDVDEKTAVYMASEMGNVECIKALQAVGATVEPEFGRSPLHVAASRGVLRLCPEKFKCDPRVHVHFLVSRWFILWVVGIVFANVIHRKFLS